MNCYATIALFAIAAALVFVGLEIRRLNNNITVISSQIEPLAKLPENIAARLNLFHEQKKQD